MLVPLGAQKRHDHLYNKAVSGGLNISQCEGAPCCFCQGSYNSTANSDHLSELNQRAEDTKQEVGMYEG